jgi:hypothetical protein
MLTAGFKLLFCLLGWLLVSSEVEELLLSTEGAEVGEEEEEEEEEEEGGEEEGGEEVEEVGHVASLVG